MNTSKYAEEYKTLEQELMSGSLSAQELMEKSKRHAFLKPIVEKENEINSTLKAIEDDRALIKEGSDKEMAALAAEELAELEAKLPMLQQELRVLVIPPDPNDSKSIYLEIRPGAGGEESALFAAELLRVYQHFADTKGWKTELLEFTPTGLKGCKYVSMFIKGDGAYSWLRDEAGTHRVQRVPDTETSGRVHTSTVTVAIMPEAADIDIEIKPEDLEQLGKNFIDSAAKHKGTMDSFLNKLEVLRKLTAEGVFAFDTNALTSYLFEYKADGYPAVSHDEIYRTTYKPAYRIVLSEMCE